LSEEEDDYEVIGEHRKHHEEQQRQLQQQKQVRRETDDVAVREDHPAGEIRTNKLPTAMELVTPTSGRRTLWCELPEVINSGLLGTTFLHRK